MKPANEYPDGALEKALEAWTSWDADLPDELIVALEGVLSSGLAMTRLSIASPREYLEKAQEKDNDAAQQAIYLMLLIREVARRRRTDPVAAEPVPPAAANQSAPTRRRRRA